MIGPNDFCSDICYQPVPEKILDYHDNYLTLALRTIRDNLPRTIVNIFAAPTMKILLDFVGTPYECVTAHRVRIVSSNFEKPSQGSIHLPQVECPCMVGSRFESEHKRYLKIMRKWNVVQHEVANREEFHNKTVKF
jgi:hypothetical protein